MNILEKFQLEFPELVNKMKNTSHHYDNFKLNPYHLEGDVWSHTMMVHNYSMDTNLHPNLNEVDLNLLQFVTLLHDVGKCYTREAVEETQRVRFFGHAGVSFYLSIEILNRFDLTEPQKRLILETISLHHNYMDILDLDCGDKARTRAFNTFVKNERLFYLLVAQMKCDSLGRFCLKHNKQYWELQNLHRHYHADFVKERKGDDETQPLSATILIGVPNSGKSHYINESTYSHGLFNQCVISTDNIIEKIGVGDDYNEKFASVSFSEVEKQMKQQFKQTIADRKSFVVDRTNVSKKSRRSFLGQLPKEYQKIGVVFATGFDEIFERNSLRKGKVLNDRVIFDKMRGFAVPTFDDFDIIHWVFSKSQKSE